MKRHALPQTGCLFMISVFLRQPGCPRIGPVALCPPISRGLPFRKLQRFLLGFYFISIVPLFAIKSLSCIFIMQESHLHCGDAYHKNVVFSRKEGVIRMFLLSSISISSSLINLSKKRVTVSLETEE